MLKFELPENPKQNISQPLSDHFRCPDDFVDFAIDKNLSSEPSFFRLGPDIICYGQCTAQALAKSVTEPLYDALQQVSMNGSTVLLPFDPVRIIDNLRHEYYQCGQALARTASLTNRLARTLYYLARPLMSVNIRKHLQRLYLRDWKRVPFPHWPVDSTVENTLEQLLVLSMNSRKQTSVPFIWFWPNGALSCTAVTHDVESVAGWNSCSQLMDIDDSFGIKSAFQIVPEDRYSVSQAGLDEIRNRGFELNIHDLNHDGNLLTDRDEFLHRAQRINNYKLAFGARGFRSAALYRNIDWYSAFDFSYDMSVPNVAHLDPQRGGCCTVFPFFNGNILELPVTMTQDYTLFNILNDYSINLWKQQIALIREKHGLMQMIVHPDYVLGASERSVYAELLSYLSALRANGKTWIALSGEVADWWRLRSKLRLVNEDGTWKIQGEGREKAQIAYARIADGKLFYDLDLSANS